QCRSDSATTQTGENRQGAECRLQGAAGEFIHDTRSRRQNANALGATIRVLAERLPVDRYFPTASRRLQLGGSAVISGSVAYLTGITSSARCARSGRSETAPLRVDAAHPACPHRW